MPRILEINRIDDLAALRQTWDALLEITPGASFFQSLDWLEVFWRHFGGENRLRILVAQDENDTPNGILPLVVRSERTSVGRLRVLTFPLHEWGSFYGPIGPNPAATLTAGLEHIRRTHRDWDFLELRWQGGFDTDPLEIRQAMINAGFQAYPTVWNHTNVVDLDGSWDGYWSTRKGAWQRRFRHDERRLAEQGELNYVRYRPNPTPIGEPCDPRWDLYETCENIAQRSWQASAADGTTLSHESIRGFLHDVHAAAAARGAVDLNLLYLNDSPVAFIYGYAYRGSIFGLRRGYDAELTRRGAGNVLLARTLHDSFARGDRIYDMGVGSFESKRYFLTRLAPILRFSHFPPSPRRMQILRLRRWWQGRHVQI